MKKKFSDDSSFDSNGLLRDGARSRVPMQMRDASVAANLARRTELLDGNLNRPGYRMPVRDNSGELTRDGKKEALQAYDRQLTNAWKNPVVRDDDGDDGDDDDDDDDTGNSYGVEGPEGSVCTVRNQQFPEAFGSPGHIQNGICVPDDFDPDAFSDARRKPVRDDRNKALRDYDKSLRDAWREGK